MMLVLPIFCDAHKVGFFHLNSLSLEEEKDLQSTRLKIVVCVLSDLFLLIELKDDKIKMKDLTD
ncbi:hypothetical protein N780_15025 [Pontibacillus chungwhensis BH030062]|uniref:Uncharacterized protein n=1 Tax=Pontibacillus chungwhensis BH030062 TaxID=1385513 RepID=A0A0A2UWT8_9BACI|nr:hypothetical protein N780_15025 [Pontibacillus chungwhensis BH030062]